VGREDPHQREGDRSHDDEGSAQGLEPANYQDEYEDEHHGEGEPQVTEDLVGDLPLAVPLEGESLAARWDVGVVLAM